MSTGVLGPRQKRYLTYAIVGLLPMISILLGMFMTGNLMISVGVSFVVALVGMFLVHRVTMNALSRLELDGLPMVAPFDSLGTIHFYNAVVFPTERMARANIEGQNVETPYTRENIINAIFHKEKVAAWSDETHDHIMIPKKDGFDSTFAMHASPTLFYNRRTKSFWTKSALGGLEDGSVLEGMVAYTNHAVKESGKYMKAYTQSLVDKLLNRIDMVKAGSIVLIILALAAIVLFGPKMWESFSSVSGTVAGSVLPSEASVPIGLIFG